MPFPPNIIRSAQAASAVDNERGYFLGGFASTGTSLEVSLEVGTTRPVPGLLTFTFQNLSLVNSTDAGYFPSIYANRQALNPGFMLQVPLYGVDGILIMMGGSYPGGAFNNITIYDTYTGSWFSQDASGDIPDPREEFCAVGMQDKSNNSYEM